MVQIQNTGDMSGTKIQSDKPITVMTGSTSTRVPSTQSNTSPSHLVGTVPHNVALGTNHYLLPIPGSSAGSVVKVVATAAGTTVSIKGTVVKTLNAGQHYTGDLGATDYTIVKTSLPALVAQFAKGKP